MSFEEMLKSLQREYLASLPGKIALIEGLIQAKDQNNVRESFHKLKGTGKTYGLPEVSEVGAIVEAICIERPVNSLAAGALALAVLRDIHDAHSGTKVYVFADDTRFAELQKLLQK
jgi:HPt (histidine-containing phosphotransfer) domain-containing protein